jgi:diacylglycerol kinase (ATP)
VVSAVAEAVRADPAAELCLIEDPGRLEEAATAAAREGFEVVAAAGGDGTVSSVASGLYRSKTEAALALVPIGTGNDLARHLGIPLEPAAALALARAAVDAGRRRSIDLIRCESPQRPGQRLLAFNAVVGGLAGRVGDRIESEHRRRWGRFAYLRAGLGELVRYRPVPIRMDVDGRRFEAEALLVVLAGGRFAGGGIPFAPSADLFDGRLDVVVISRTPAWRIPVTLLRVLRARHIGADNVLFTRGRRVELEAGGDFWMNVDGETWVPGCARFEVEPAALPVLLPAGRNPGNGAARPGVSSYEAPRRT